MRKILQQKKFELLYSIIIMKLFYLFDINYINLFSKIFKNNIYILIFIDYFSHFVIIFAILNILTTTITQCL